METEKKRKKLNEKINSLSYGAKHMQYMYMNNENNDYKINKMNE